MTKVLYYKEERYPLTDEEAKELSDYLSEAKRDDHFTFKGQSLIVRHAEIRDGAEKKERRFYSLNNPEDKKIIKEFEQELLDARDWELDRELEYYGEPIKTIKAVGKAPEKELPDGFVRNPILGLCHWSKVQYCLKNCIISRKDGKWFIADANNYTDWLEKNNALHDLKLRREFAENKNKEETDEFLKSLEPAKVAKPIPEVEIEIPDDNPLKWM